MNRTDLLSKRLKGAVIRIIGRQHANRLSAPYYDWRARCRTRAFLAHLPPSGLRLNLGCGYRPLPGWVNVDRARGPAVDVVWDLRHPLPFSSDSFLAIFCEHVLEHLTKPDAADLVRECRRILQPGGVIRLSTPDAERFLRSYATDRSFLFHPGFAEAVEMPLDRINLMMREFGQHLWVYDADSLVFLLQRAGFSKVIPQAFGQSIHPLMKDIDSSAREFESLYVEATK